MVFYVPPKRRETKLCRPSVSNIADETILQILEDLPTSDILKLRLSCSNVVPACDTALQKRLTALYLHPSAEPMKKALEICSHPVLSQEIEKACPSYRCADLQPHYSHPAGDAWQNDFRTWPKTLLPPVGGNDQHGRSVALSETFEDDYEPLIRALARLPKLRKIAIAEYAKKPGFNQVRERAIQTHANKFSITERRDTGGAL